MRANPGFHKKVHLMVVAEDWSPESTSRRLRELQEEGSISVDYYDGRYAKGLARYSADESPKKEVRKVEIINGKAVMVTKYE